MPAPSRIAPRLRLRYAPGAILLCLLAFPSHAADWPRFRGDNGAGVSADSAPLPSQWSDTQNRAWSAPLPGPGSSCPIVVGDRVIVTCWTGADAPEMVRHVLAFDRSTGKQLWDTPCPPTVPDEPYGGMFAQHGYASHTPVSDGEHIYCFFGVSGLAAFDMEGKLLWQKDCGHGFDPSNWGSASSPILYKDLVIVTAAAESTSLIAFDKHSGEERWRQQAAALESTWGTPVLVDAGEGRQDLAIAVPGEVWGVNPDTGKLRWYCATPGARSQCSSVIADDGIVYLIGGRDGGSVAVHAGGKDDVSESNVVWTNNLRGGIGTAVMADGLIYCLAGGTATCIDAKDGKQVYEKRLSPPTTAALDPAVQQAQATDPPQSQPQTQNERPQGFGPPGSGGGFGRGGGGRGGRGGGFGAQDYSSPIVADGKLYFVRRNGETYVLETGRTFKTLAVNKFDDDGDFSASPAASDGQLFIRSSKNLYCVSAKE